MANNTANLPKIRLADSLGLVEEKHDSLNETFIPVVDPIIGGDNSYTLKKIRADFINKLYTLIEEFNEFYTDITGSNGALAEINSKINDISTFVEEIETNIISPELRTNTIYNANATIEIIQINIPDLSENIDDKKYISQLNFTSLSGETPTAINSSTTNLRWIGDDVEDNTFTPVANKRYAVMFSSDGMFIKAVVQSVIIEIEE